MTDPVRLPPIADVLEPLTEAFVEKAGNMTPALRDADQDVLRQLVQTVIIDTYLTLSGAVPLTVWSDADRPNYPDTPLADLLAGAPLPVRQLLPTTPVARGGFTYAPVVWSPALPEPLWVGPFLRIAQCECGERFWLKARVRYEAHWQLHHAADHAKDPSWPQQARGGLAQRPNPADGPDSPFITRQAP